MSYCDSCVVRNRAICAALDSNEIQALNGIGRRRVLERMDETAALAKAGAMLGNWLRLGLIAGIAAA